MLVIFTEEDRANRKCSSNRESVAVQQNSAVSTALAVSYLHGANGEYFYVEWCAGEVSLRALLLPGGLHEEGHKGSARGKTVVCYLCSLHRHIYM